MKRTKKSLLFGHIIEERRARETYADRAEKFLEEGQPDRFKVAYQRACDAAARESAFICAASIFLGLSGNDLEAELAIYVQDVEN